VIVSFAKSPHRSNHERRKPLPRRHFLNNRSETLCRERSVRGGLELATEIRAIVLRVSDRRDAGRRCQAGRCMFSIHHSHRFASAPGHMTTAKKSTNIISRSQRKADFQPASAEGPRTRRKNRLRIRKTLASIAQKRHNFVSVHAPDRVFLSAGLACG
jgi:hypothetical protein